MSSRATISEWMEEIPETLRELPWVTEALCLPWSAGQWTLLFESDSVLVRWAEAEGREPKWRYCPLCWKVSMQSKVVVVAYGQDEVLPKHLSRRGFTISYSGVRGLSEALLLAEPARRARPATGRVCPQLPLKRWWGVWQQVAVALGVALILKTGLSVADYQTLKAEDLQLRQAIQDSYRRINPRGAVVDVEKQLNRQLAELAPARSTGPSLLSW